LEKAGFVVTRQTGSHLFLVNREVRRATVVAMHNRDVTKAMLQAVIQQAGLSAEELVRLLAH
jgi:predicted RNA binding protein YcfA (HicA-like mRNA interferase family)